MCNRRIGTVIKKDTHTLRLKIIVKQTHKLQVLTLVNSEKTANYHT